MDDGKAAAISRLSEGEKLCLRRRLIPQTAKEMAIDLGISPHAVEKRLKMARAKLGVSSSLAAARLLAEAEGYQVLVPQGPDLPQPDPSNDDQQGAHPSISAARTRVLKGLSMIIGLYLLALIAQDATVPSAPAAPPMLDNGKPAQSRKVGMDEAAAFDRMAFQSLDADRSGFLDAREVTALEPAGSARDKTLPPAPPPGQFDSAASAKWMAKLDTNRDGKVSEAEYVSYMVPWTLWTGVPADWGPAHDGPVAASLRTGQPTHR